MTVYLPFPTHSDGVGEVIHAATINALQDGLVDLGLNVKGYGAPTDGSDATSFLNAVIADYNDPTKNGVVWVPPGTYAVSSMLTPLTRDGVWVAGLNAVTVEYHADFTGDYVTDTPTDYHSTFGIFKVESARVAFKGFTFDGAEMGDHGDWFIWFDTAHSSSVTECHFQNLSGTNGEGSMLGAVISWFGDHITFSRNTSTDCPGTFASFMGNHITIDHNTVINPADAAFSISGGGYTFTPTNSYGNEVSWNYIECSGTHRGWLIDLSRGVTGADVVHNTIRGNRSNGAIAVESFQWPGVASEEAIASSNINIESNLFDDLDSSDTSNAAQDIYLGEYVEGVTLFNNRYLNLSKGLSGNAAIICKAGDVTFLRERLTVGTASTPVSLITLFPTQATRKNITFEDCEVEQGSVDAAITATTGDYGGAVITVRTTKFGSGNVGISEQAGCTNLTWKIEDSNDYGTLTTPVAILSSNVASNPTRVLAYLAATGGAGPSSTTETDLFSYSVPANLLGLHRSLRLTYYAFTANFKGSAGTIQFALKFGGTVIWRDTTPNIANGDIRAVKIVVDLKNVASASVQKSISVVRVSAQGLGGLDAAAVEGYGDLAAAELVDSTIYGASAVDTTAAVTFALTGKMSASDANFYLATKGGSLELV